MIEGSDPISARVFALLQVSPKDGIVDHIQEGGDGMPALVIEPHLQETTSVSERYQVHQIPNRLLSPAEHPFLYWGHIISFHILPASLLRDRTYSLINNHKRLLEASTDLLLGLRSRLQRRNTFWGNPHKNTSCICSTSKYRELWSAQLSKANC